MSQSMSNKLATLYDEIEELWSSLEFTRNHIEKLVKLSENFLWTTVEKLEQQQQKKTPKKQTMK